MQRALQTAAAFLVLFSGSRPAAFACGTPAQADKATRAVPATAAVGKRAPTFSLPDVAGKKRALSEAYGVPALLFFSCGCSWCGDVAKELAALQRSGALPIVRRDGTGKSAEKGTSPLIMIIYSEMESASAKALTAFYGFDSERTVSLLDGDLSVTRTQYRVDPCPRLFVLDVAGTLRYTNDGPDDAPQKAPAIAIVSRALDALRRAAASTDKSLPKKHSPAGKSR